MMIKSMNPLAFDWCDNSEICEQINDLLQGSEVRIKKLDNDAETLIAKAPYTDTGVIIATLLELGEQNGMGIVEQCNAIIKMCENDRDRVLYLTPNFEDVVDGLREGGEDVEVFDFEDFIVAYHEAVSSR